MINNLALTLLNKCVGSEICISSNLEHSEIIQRKFLDKIESTNLKNNYYECIPTTHGHQWYHISL